MPLPLHLILSFKSFPMKYVMGLFILLSCSITLWTQESVIPESYQLVYEQDFHSPSSVKDFEMSDPGAWQIGEADNRHFLSLINQSNYQPRVRSPFNVAVLKTPFLRDFIMEIEAAQTGREYGHRDLCFFFGFVNPSNFYYVHMASKTDDHANNIFIVNDEPRKKISTETSSGTAWAETNSWHKIRIVRTIEDGMILVYFDDMTSPVMRAEDTHFDIGRIGLGSFDDTGNFSNLKVWAPKVYETKKGLFD